MSQKYGLMNDGGYNANVMPQPQQPYPGQGQVQPPPYQTNQPAPAYGAAPQQPQQPQQQQSATVIPATSTTVLVQRAPVPWKWSTTIIASVALWFCCTPLAFCGLLYAIHSYVDHKSADYANSSSKLRMAWICTICSITIGVLFWVIFIILYAVAIDRATDGDHYRYN